MREKQFLGVETTQDDKLYICVYLTMTSKGTTDPFATLQLED